MKPYIHERSDFKDLIAALGASIRIQNELVEKDYWLMHAMWGLQKIGFSYELKGGTSLSKGWGCIDRFSEDIDILIRTEGIETVPFGKNQTKPAHIEKRKEYYLNIFQQLKITGFESIAIDSEFTDTDQYKNIGARLHYPKLFGPIEGLKDGILLEIGYDQTTPNEERLISSWIFDKAVEVGIDTAIEDNRATNVKCYVPEYTFVEKLQTISTKYRQQQQSNSKPVNFLRHYYDLSQLLKLERVQKFIGTKDYYAHKEKRFRTSDEQDLTKNEAFILSDVATYKKYKEEFLISKNLYFKGQPDFESFLKDLTLWLPKL